MKQGNSGVQAAKPTQGPWEASMGVENEPDRWVVQFAGPTHWVIATVENGQPGDTLETEAATARLISAAPELLEALKQLSKTNFISFENHTIINALIAKAEGTE